MTLDDEEKRLEIFERDKWTCQVCGKWLREGVPQLAHRIAQTKANIRKYGKEVIHHPLNLVSVCSLRCNSACNIGFNRIECERLIGDIRGTL